MSAGTSYSTILKIYLSSQYYRLSTEELMLSNYGAGKDSWKSLACKIKPVNPKGNQHWIFTGRTDAEARDPILWPPNVKTQLITKDLDAGKNWGQAEKWVTEDEMVRLHHWLHGHEFEQTQGNSEGQGKEAWFTAVHEVPKSWTGLSDWTTTIPNDS